MARTTTMQEDEEAELRRTANKTASRKVRPKMRFKHKFLLILVSLVLMGMLRTGFIFVIIAMLPTIVAYYTDVTAERYTFKTIFACNLSGLLPSLDKMLLAGHSSALLQTTMGNLSNWMIIYGAAMVGWLLIEICPMIAHMMIVGFHQTQITRIDRLQKKIQGEWGPEVMQIADDFHEEEE